MGVYSELKPHTISATSIKKLKPRAIIFSGGPNSVTGENALGVDPQIFELGIPILGICYGMQLMAHDLPGGATETADSSEYGQAQIEVTDQNSRFFQNMEDKQTVLMSHGDFVTQVPNGFKVTATSDSCPISAMADPSRGFYAVQFHPEVNLTAEGREMLRHFVFDIAKATANWSMDDFIADAIADIRTTVGDQRVILGLSGGVDSSVVAVLLHRAIGNQLIPVFVDHGLLRKKMKLSKYYMLWGMTLVYKSTSLMRANYFSVSWLVLPTPNKNEKSLARNLLTPLLRRHENITTWLFWHKEPSIQTSSNREPTPPKRLNRTTMSVACRKIFSSN